MYYDRRKKLIQDHFLVPKDFARTIVQNKIVLQAKREARIAESFFLRGGIFPNYRDKL